MIANLKKGFTLIELVMVIVIIGILAIVAIPRFINMQSDASAAAEAGIVGGVRSAIVTYYSNHKAFSATLDNASSGDCTTGNPCFINVLTQGGVTSEWRKIDDAHYRGPTGTVYTYSLAGVDAGSFK